MAEFLPLFALCPRFYLHTDRSNAMKLTLCNRNVVQM